MAAVAAPSSPGETLDPKSNNPETLEQANPNPVPSPLPPAEAPSTNNLGPSPNPTVLAPPSAPSFTPSFGPAPPRAPQFSPLVNPPISPAMPNPAFQPSGAPSPNVQPPGVAAASATPASVSFPGTASGVAAALVPPVPPPGVYYSVPGQAPAVAPRPYWQPPPPNGYMSAPAPQAQGLTAPPGMPRYPGPYMVRPGFAPRPPVPISIVPPASRPLVPGAGGPIVPPVVRPNVPFVAPTEKPQTTVYVGKIASTVDNDFLLSLLNLCGPVKSWKRAQDPSDGTPRGFGFCEFESAEGVLRALRLLSKLNIDGQELVLNIKQATREYLERYVAKKTEREKHKETESDVANGKSSIPTAEKQGSPKTDEVLKKEDDNSEDKEKQDIPQKFGIVTDVDRDADKDALEKIKGMIEERLKNKPLPPPPPVAHTDCCAKSNSELPSKAREGESDIMQSAEDKNEEEITSENKHTERDKSVANLGRSRRHDRSRERDREHDMKRDKERELERYERERERQRLRREREREMKIREAERQYKDRLKDWEAREREKEYQRKYEKEKEKEREIKRRKEIIDQEDESDDDDTRKRRHRGGTFEEKRRRVLHEKEDDMVDRVREGEDIAEARKRAIEEQKKDDCKPIMPPISNGDDNFGTDKDDDNFGTDKDDDCGTYKCDLDIDGIEIPAKLSKESDSVDGDGMPRNGSGEEFNVGFVSVADAKWRNSISSRKLGFGLMTSGKRTSVPSVFHEEDDEDANKYKKMRPLVPIDYSTEELQAIHVTATGTPPNLVAAAEFAKCISVGKSKEEKSQSERERSHRNNDRHRDRGRNDDDSKHSRHETREKVHDKSLNRDRDHDHNPKNIEKKLLDAKQLIDMIPKTKEALFSYEINWAVYDKHELHERMKPWISKKITEFLGEEEDTLVDYIVSSTKDHVQASEMLQLLQPILDEEAEMFVLKMWRMLIFEIKKVETGLSTKTRT